ncbi:MAG TPA: glycine--tRNA ligase subunit beta, partial [Bryobacteraceae bacterium]|nr:glycine--tRNA ligase subunit beta [Bryobacteraceae bacterium]
MPDFLLEIGVEEIPDWMIGPALADLRARWQAVFGAFESSALITDATPRRLVLLAKDLAEQAADVESVVQGPYLSAGKPAAEGFARKWNTSVAALATTQDAKGERYIFHQRVKGQTAKEALAAKLPEVIANIAWPKSMYWTGKGGVRFIRPIRWIVALLDAEAVPFEVAGVRSGNTTRGHRILGAKEPLAVSVATYFEVLLKNFVIVSAEE